MKYAIFILMLVVNGVGAVEYFALMNKFPDIGDHGVIATVDNGKISLVRVCYVENGKYRVVKAEVQYSQGKYAFSFEAMKDGKPFAKVEQGGTIQVVDNEIPRCDNVLMKIINDDTIIGDGKF